MLDPDDIVSRMPHWLRIALVGFVVVIVTSAGLFAWRYVMQPTTLTVAAGSADGEAVRVMSAVASRLTSTKSNIRLKVIDTGNAREAAKTFAAGKVDLAIIRADASDLSAARTVVLVTHLVVLLIAPSGGNIEGIEDLKGKTVGVVGAEMNGPIVAALTREYDLARAKVHFTDLASADIQAALKAKRVQALLLAMPLSEKYLALVRSFFQAGAKRKPALIALESAEAIATLAKAYESYDLPKGAVRGSPPIPDEDLTTLRVPVYLVANKNLGDDVVTNLTTAIMETRRDLLSEYPLLAQVGAPDTDKDAFIPVHPGAAAYFDGTQQGFFDKYSNALYYGPMALGAFASLLAGLWKFLGVGVPGTGGNALEPLHALARRIRKAESEEELGMLEEDIDNILQGQLTKYARGALQAGDAAALSLAAQRLEHLIEMRRNALTAGLSVIPIKRAVP